MKKMYKKALKCWYRLKKIVDNFNGTLEELCDELGGHNLEDDLFDINFEWICGTIVQRDNKLELIDNIEIWEDKNFEFLGEFDIEWLEKNI